MTRWCDSQSIPFHIPRVTDKQLAHLVNEKATKTPEKLPHIGENVPQNLETIKFLNSKHFNYTLGTKTNPMLQGMNVSQYIEGLINGNPPKMSASKETSGNGVTMFCGGPISALAICPRTDATGLI